jgi:two-component system chemotaxis response regulator CheY
MAGRILIIDDALHLRQMLKITLEYKGYTVAEAENGLEGLKAAQGQPFDLILCDIEMPVMNGVEFVRRFRDELGSATPIVMLTAEGGDLMKRALAAGATASLTKPFEPIALLSEIEKYVGQPAD